MEETPGSLMGQWCLQEFASIDFGDERINRRFLHTASQLATLPQASISQACQTRAAVKGAYRLFSHDKFDREEVMEVHVKNTLERIKGCPRILVIQDTTYLEFGSHKKTKGLGPLASKQRGHLQGLLSHVALAVSPEGLSLGILDQRIWARENPDFEDVLEGDKESSKWLQLLQQTKKIVPPETQTVTIADREADITGLLQEATAQKMSFVIRARERLIKKPEYRWLSDHLLQQPVVQQYEVTVPIKPSKTAQRVTAYRKAKIGVRFARVAIQTKKPAGVLELDAILAQEDGAPSEFEPVSWVLLTNEAVNSVKDAMERIHWYEQRWHIENFHRVLKSGCTVEKTRLQEAEKLDRYITLMSVIAWRLYWLTHLSRTQPEESCEQVLARDEWKVLHLQMFPEKTLPKIPPTLREATSWIGRLGGFIKTKKYPDPGVITVWKGLQRLHDIHLGFQIMRRAAISGEL